MPRRTRTNPRSTSNPSDPAEGHKVFHPPRYDEGRLGPRVLDGAKVDVVRVGQTVAGYYHGLRGNPYPELERLPVHADVTILVFRRV
jgi:hypothetical protein